MGLRNWLILSHSLQIGWNRKECISSFSFQLHPILINSIDRTYYVSIPFLFIMLLFHMNFILEINWHCFCCADLNCTDRYVDLLLGEFKHFKTRLAHGGIRKEVLLLFIIMKQYSSNAYITIYWRSAYQYLKIVLLNYSSVKAQKSNSSV
jgi:hypothetical protein